MAEMLKKAMVYLGLVDDEYEDYDPYDESAQPAPARAGNAGNGGTNQVVDVTEPTTMTSIRALARDTREESPAVTVTSRSAVVRPISPSQSAKVHVVEPVNFSDAQEIGDRLKVNQPVIVTMQEVGPDLARRLIDFCSGATYVLGGSMERVAKSVFLLTPSNVEVSAEEKRRLQERGLYRS